MAYTRPILPDATTSFRPPASTRMGAFWRSWWNRSCGSAWWYQSIAPVRASSARTEFEYRLGPGRLEPFGKSLVPGAGAGLPVDQNTVPDDVSTAGVLQMPAPLLTAGSPQNPLATVW